MYGCMYAFTYVCIVCTVCMSVCVNMYVCIVCMYECMYFVNMILEQQVYVCIEAFMFVCKHLCMHV